MKRFSISDIFESKFSPMAGFLPPNWTELHPTEAAAFVLSCAEFSEMPIFLNLATAWVNWWAIPLKKRRIYSIKPQTALELQAKGINFTPSQAPGAWGGRAAIVEADDGGNLVGDIWSIAGYMNRSQARNRLELCIVWLEGDGAYFASFPAGVEIQIADPPEFSEGDMKYIDEMTALESYIFDDGSPEYRRSAVAALRMLLAVSYRAGNVFKLKRRGDFGYMVSL